MSAHYGAPGFRRPQLATPAYSAEPSSMPTRTSGQPVVKRRAMLVAAATLCAPALAVVALGAIGATTGGDQAGMGSLAGTTGLRGSTVAAPSGPTSSPAAADKRDAAKGSTSEPPADTHHARQHPATPAPAPRPSHPRTPPPSNHIGRTPPHTQPTAPSTPTYDPTQPGAPTTSGTGSGSGGTTTTSGSGTGSGTGTTSGSGSGSTSGTGSDTSGPSDVWDGYSGGG
jgi:hypothetical protein